jgi:hypothetical protein
MVSNCKFFLKIICLIVTFFLVSSSFVSSQNVDAEFRLKPGSGWIKHGEDFVIDVLIDTKGQDVTLARTALSFDPSLIQIVAAERNEGIFCEWPAQEQIIDNEEGLVVATGFCNRPPYATKEGQEDVFVRLTLETIREDNLEIIWEYSGRDEPEKSVIMKDGSPPQNLLFASSAEAEPISGNYTISLLDPNIPDTNITTFKGYLILGVGIILASIGLYIFFDPQRKNFNKSRTVVVYEN